MTTETAEEVTIQITAEDVFRSIAMLEDMRDFVKKMHGEHNDVIDALGTAIETMEAFCVEHFREELEGDE